MVFVEMKFFFRFFFLAADYPILYNSCKSINSFRFFFTNGNTWSLIAMVPFNLTY